MNICKIKSYKRIGIEDSVDIEVNSRDHNFILDGLVCSNSHAVSYAYLSAMTVYLKFNYPREFYCAWLKMAKFESDSQGEISSLNHELKNFNIQLLPPDLSRSQDDFSIDGPDIRYGLSCIKGLGEKVLAPLNDFKTRDRSNKYEIFRSAEDSKLNVGALSALIQSGALSSLGQNRPKMVLEAQSFKILTDREKRIVNDYAEKYNYDLLLTISEMKGKLATDGKIFMPESRWNTFKDRFDKYKQIYSLNAKHRKFADWWFEKQLLGYSYSQKLNECFEDSLDSVSSIKSLSKDTQVKFVGAVEEVVLRKSAKGNRYLRLTVSDEGGTTSAILVDSPKNKKLTDYIDGNGAIPSKKSVVSIIGKTTGDGAVFIEQFSILDAKIYMKLSEVK